MSCECGAAGFWQRHDPDCPVVELNRRPRIDCSKCEEDDQPQAKGEWFISHDYCAHCEDNYEPPEPDGEDFRGGEAAAFREEQQDAARRLK